MPAGRPTKYNPDYCEQARKLCLLGYTDDELADFFNVHRDTIYEWKKVYPDFSDALLKGKQLADAEVAAGLYKRATGFSHMIKRNMKSEEGPIEYEDELYFPPDTQAASRWLFNRQSSKWRPRKAVDEKQEMEEKKRTTIKLPDGTEIEV